MNPINTISLKPVDPSDWAFLFKMLKERTPLMAISFEMPSFDNHVTFCNSKPYDAWYIIQKDGIPIGNIYLTDKNEIGIFISKPFQGLRAGSSAIDLLIKKHPRKYYLANISPWNHFSQKFFVGRGFQLVQYTYKKHLDV